MTIFSANTFLESHFLLHKTDNALKWSGSIEFALDFNIDLFLVPISYLSWFGWTHIQVDAQTLQMRVANKDPSSIMSNIIDHNYELWITDYMLIMLEIFWQQQWLFVASVISQCNALQLFAFYSVYCSFMEGSALIK